MYGAEGDEQTMLGRSNTFTVKVRWALTRAELKLKVRGLETSEEQVENVSTQEGELT